MKVSPSAFDDETKRRIRERQGGRCAYCGIPCSTAHFHHRKPRRMGGSSDPSLGKASNGVMLHPKCHDRIESDRAWAIAYGWLVTETGDPEKMPLLMWNGWRLLVGDDLITLPAHHPEMRETLGVSEVVPVPTGEGG